MLTTLRPPNPTRHPEWRDQVPPLENGAQLTAREFLRRYSAMPEVKKAELVNGIVHMASPVRTKQHADPDSLMQGWLFNYSIATSGTRASTNGTLRLSPDDVPQPDASLRLLPECGGRSRVDEKGYLNGPPELVVEIAASSASLDVNDKLTAYRRAGVREYLVWRTEDECVDWWELIEDEYRHLPEQPDGSIRRRVFPGLWLHPEALLDLAAARLMTTLREGLASAEHAAFVAELAEHSG